MSKFKVGDKIIGNEKANSRYTLTRKGWVGEVAKIDGYGFSAVSKDRGLWGGRFDGLNPDCFDLASPRHELHITCTDGKTTNAIYKVNGKIVERKQAICAPSDTFDFATGAEIAFDRVFPQAAQPTPSAEDKPKFKVGDTVYEALLEWDCTECLKTSFKPKVRERKVTHFVFGKSGDIIVGVAGDGADYLIYGKTVFLTPEEAEAALKEAQHE